MGGRCISSDESFLECCRANATGKAHLFSQLAQRDFCCLLRVLFFFHFIFAAFPFNCCLKLLLVTGNLFLVSVTGFCHTRKMPLAFLHWTCKSAPPQSKAAASFQEHQLMLRENPRYTSRSMHFLFWFKLSSWRSLADLLKNNALVSVRKIRFRCQLFTIQNVAPHVLTMMLHCFPAGNVETFACERCSKSCVM